MCRDFRFFKISNILGLLILNEPEYLFMKHLAILAVVLLATNCKSPRPEGCGRFKTGRFESHALGMIFKISRNDTIQTEIIPAFGDTTKISVKWLDDCHYQLQMLESNVAYPDTVEHLRKKAIIAVEIINWTNDYYIYKAGDNLTNKTSIDTLWIDHSR
jgi:hypothetical protein